VDGAVMASLTTEHCAHEWATGSPGMVRCVWCNLEQRRPDGVVYHAPGADPGPLLPWKVPVADSRFLTGRDPGDEDR
jgi:hypothetical protein